MNTITQHHIAECKLGMEVEIMTLILLCQLLQHRNLTIHDYTIIDGPTALESRNWRTKINLWTTWQCLQCVYHRLHTLTIFLYSMRPIMRLGVIGAQLDHYDIWQESLRILPS